MAHAAMRAVALVAAGFTLGLYVEQHYASPHITRLASHSPLPRVFSDAEGGEAHLPGAHSSISFAAFPPGATKTVTLEEESEHAPCSFIDIKTREQASCTVETYTRMMIRNFIKPTDQVMELGARFGTASCEIADVLQNNGALISVDPDPHVWPSHEYNRHTHSCSSWLVRGVIANRAAAVEPNSYGTRGVPIATSDGQGDGHVRAHYTLEEIQTITGLTLTVLVIDCEGCLPFLFPSEDIHEALANIRLIIMEGDMPSSVPGSDCKHDCVDYKVWEARLQAEGFDMVEKSQEELFPWIYNYVFLRPELASGPPQVRALRE